MPSDHHVWQVLTADDDGKERLARCRVPGGWLYRSLDWQWTHDDQWGVLCHVSASSLAFVPDAGGVRDAK